MQIVHFPEEFQARAPDIMGRLRVAHSHKWVAPADVLAAVNAGHAVTIRPATVAELARAEEYMALYGIHTQLATHVGSQLDQASSMEPHARFEAGMDALASCDVSLAEVFAEASTQEALAGSVAAIAKMGTTDLLTDLYVAMRQAYVDGDRDAVFSLDNHIQTILFGSAAAEVAIAHAKPLAE
jgi:hypothetical protein